MNNKFHESLIDVISDIEDMLLHKRRDYGSDNIMPSDPGLHIEDRKKAAYHGILIRLKDKIARAENLVKTGNKPNYETLGDTWKDIAGYAIIAEMIFENKWE